MFYCDFEYMFTHALIISQGYDPRVGGIVPEKIQGVLVGLSLWAIGIEGAAFWGSVVFPLSAVPGLGTPLVWLPAAGYVLLTGSIGSDIGLVKIWMPFRT